MAKTIFASPVFTMEKNFFFSTDWKKLGNPVYYTYTLHLVFLLLAGSPLFPLSALATNTVTSDYHIISPYYGYTTNKYWYSTFCIESKWFISKPTVYIVLLRAVLA